LLYENDKLNLGGNSFQMNRLLFAERKSIYLDARIVGIFQIRKL